MVEFQDKNDLFSDFCGGEFWNISQAWDTETPSLGWCIERTVLVWVPCCVLVLCGALTLVYLRRATYPKSPLPWNTLLCSRLALSIAVMVAAVGEVVVVLIAAIGHDGGGGDDLSTPPPPPADLVAALVLTVTYGMAVVLVTAFKHYGKRSSGLLFAFWGLMVLCGVPQVVDTLTLLLQNKGERANEEGKFTITTTTNTQDIRLIQSIVFLVQYSGGVLLLVLNCFADRLPPPKGLEKIKESTEVSVSFPNWATFHWVNELLWVGWKRPLTQQDLWVLPKDCTCEAVDVVWRSAWRKEVAAKRHQQALSGTTSRQGVGTATGTPLRVSLAKVALRAYIWPFLLCWFLLFISEMMLFFNPQILGLLINFTTTGDEEPAWHGYLYAILLLLIGTMSLFCRQIFLQLAFKVCVRLRLALSMAVYCKALNMAPSARREYSAGEIINLMSVDANRVSEFVVLFVLGLVIPFSFIVAMQQLWGMMGPSVLSGLAVLVLLIPLNVVVANRVKILQSAQMKHKDKRIRLSSEIINGIKMLKLYAWEKPFGRMVEEVRREEIKILRKMTYLMSFMSFIWFTTPYLVSLMTFTTFILVSADNVLDAKMAFVSIAIINLLCLPIIQVPSIIAQGIQAKVSLKRLEKFLASPNLDPHAVCSDEQESSAIVVRDGEFTWGCTETQKAGVETQKRDKEKENMEVKDMETENKGLETQEKETGEEEERDMEKRGTEEQMRFLGTQKGDTETQEGAADVWALKGMDLEVSQGSLVAVVGGVGAGKTSLLSALLGQMDKMKGKVIINGKVAYVSQEVWLQNATIRDNITWGHTYEESRYLKVVEVCALRPDFNIFPAGDLTEIGEKGITLSGGQKQRVSLARAAYSGASVLLLDDPLSAVDSNVGRHIFDHLIGPDGMWKEKTRVLVTHALWLLPRTDKVLVMEGGRLVECGTCDHLMEAGGNFSRYLLQHLRWKEGVEEEEEEEAEQEEDDEDGDDDNGLEELCEQLEHTAGRQALLRQLSQCNSNTNSVPVPSPRRFRRQSSTISSTSSQQRKTTTTTGTYKRCNSTASATSQGRMMEQRIEHGETGAAGVLVEEETSSVGRVKCDVYMFYAKAIGVLSMLLPLALFFLAQGSQVGSSIWLSIWSSPQTQPTTNDNTTTNTTEEFDGIVFLSGYAAFGIGQPIFYLTGTALIKIGCLKAGRVIHHKLLDAILHLPTSFFDTNPSGRVMNRLSKEMNALDIILPRLMVEVVAILTQIVVMLGVVVVSSPMVCAVVLPVLVVYLLVLVVYVTSHRQIKRIESVASSPVYTFFRETVQGVSTIRAFRREQSFIQECQAKIDGAMQAFMAIVINNRWLGVRLESIGNLVVFSAAVFAVASRDTISPGTVGLSITYALSVSSILNYFVRVSSDFEVNIVAVERIKEYIEEDQEAPWEVENPPPRSWPEGGGLVFSGYKTRYRPGLELVLKDVTCTVRSGEKVGIVGRTGAGKSSLALAMLRIVEAADGSIMLDGQNIAKVGLHDLRSRITIIPQDPMLFSGTLRFNVDPCGTHGDTAVWHALKLAHLAPLVRSHPLGLMMEVEEGGANLSAGQRQLVGLTRALLRKSPLLLLDEATAAVDMETDSLIQDTIRAEFAECTVLTIAHRLNTIMDSDRVLVMSHGRIVEFDSPSALIAQQDSIFSVMAKDAGLV